MDLHTIVKEIPVLSKQEMYKAGADFAIVTNPKEADKTVNLGDYKDMIRSC